MCAAAEQAYSNSSDKPAIFTYEPFQTEHLQPISRPCSPGRWGRIVPAQEADLLHPYNHYNVPLSSQPLKAPKTTVLTSSSEKPMLMEVIPPHRTPRVIADHRFCLPGTHQLDGRANAVVGFAESRFTADSLYAWVGMRDSHDWISTDEMKVNHLVKSLTEEYLKKPLEVQNVRYTATVLDRRGVLQRGEHRTGADRNPKSAISVLLVDEHRTGFCDPEWWMELPNNRRQSGHFFALHRYEVIEVGTLPWCGGWMQIQTPSQIPFVSPSHRYSPMLVCSRCWSSRQFTCSGGAWSRWTGLFAAGLAAASGWTLALGKSGEVYSAAACIGALYLAALVYAWHSGKRSTYLLSGLLLGAGWLVTPAICLSGAVTAHNAHSGRH